MSLTGVWMNELSSDPHCGNGSNGLLVENGKAVWDSGENDSQAAVRTSTAADGCNRAVTLVGTMAQVLTRSRSIKQNTSTG